LIPRWLAANPLRRRGEGLLNLKGLLTVFSSSGGAILSGFVGRLKRNVADLLIPRGLLASLLSRTAESLLNLKDLLTVFPPSPKRLFENRPVLSPLFCAESHQIPRFSSKNVQVMPENDGFSRPIFIRACVPIAWDASEA